MSQAEQNGYLADSWIDPRLELKHSPISGLGVFTKAQIREREL